MSRLATALGIGLTFLFSTGASADPAPAVPDVFCFRITDIERVPAGGPNAFLFEFEFLNWTGTPAEGIDLTMNVGTSSLVGGIPSIAVARVDENGRGGPPAARTSSRTTRRASARRSIPWRTRAAEAAATSVVCSTTGVP